MPMRRETRAERAAWTDHILGKQDAPVNKYGNKKTEFDGRMYDSQREANIAAKLQMLERVGDIWNLQYQFRILLVPGEGKVRPITYIADFFYNDAEGGHFLDAKGFRTPIFRLKKKMAALLLSIEIEEV